MRPQHTKEEENQGTSEGCRLPCQAPSSPLRPGGNVPLLVLRRSTTSSTGWKSLSPLPPLAYPLAPDGSATGKILYISSSTHQGWHFLLASPSLSGNSPKGRTGFCSDLQISIRAQWVVDPSSSGQVLRIHPSMSPACRVYSQSSRRSAWPWRACLCGMSGLVTMQGRGHRHGEVSLANSLSRVTRISHDIDCLFQKVPTVFTCLKE